MSEQTSITSESVRGLFSQKNYIIPDYQRPYTWDEEQCENLWNDLIETFQEGEAADDKLKPYFLGSLVVYKENNSYYVVDGQQRLTSLLLLMKALFTFRNSYSAIEDLMYVKDDEKEIVKDKHRLTSNVIPLQNEPSDKEQLLEVLNIKTIEEIEAWSGNKEANRFQRNCAVFLERIKSACNPGNPLDKEHYKDFVTLFLDRVYVSFIVAGNNFHSALQIFYTLNARGIDLDPIDIIKARIYAKLNSQEKRGEFVRWWDSIRDKLNEYLDTYRILCQAKELANSDKRKDTLKFYEEEIRQNDVSVIIENIKKMEYCFNYIDDNINIQYWFKAVYSWPVNLLRYPCYAYIYKNISGADGEYSFTGSEQEAVKIIWNVMRFACPVGVVSKRRDKVDKSLYRACDHIMENKPMELPALDASYNNGAYVEDRFKEGLGWPAKYTQGILALYHVLNPKQQADKNLDGFDLPKFEIEHILPKADQHYDGWPEEEVWRKWWLGNQVLLTKKLNIKAKNEYFEKKKEEAYQHSSNKDVSDPENGLCSLSAWTPTECDERFEKITKRLCDFLYHGVDPAPAS